ncbi:MAG: peptidylprolyl isomerase [Candidatus Paceibacterota bacterium]
MNNNEEVTNTFLRIVTNLGEITVELYMDSAPITAGNFLSLVEAGFYNNIKFHRVIPGFMIQGGDPNTKEDDETIYGTGGPGYSIQDEFSAELSNVEGTLSMANAGPNTGGSQFFINTADNTFLDGKHAVFGHVVSGLETVSKIESTQTKERDIPATPVVIEQITVTGE